MIVAWTKREAEYCRKSILQLPRQNVLYLTEWSDIDKIREISHLRPKQVHHHEQCRDFTRIMSFLQQRYFHGND